MSFFKKDDLIAGLNYVNLISALLLVASLPVYYSKLQYWSLNVFFITYIIELFIEKKWKSVTWDKSKWVFIVMIIYFMLQFLYYPFEGNYALFNKILEQRLSFIGFSIVGIFGFNKFYKIRYFAYMFILCSFVIICYLIFNKIGFKNFILSKDKEHLFGQTRIKYVHGHMIFNSFLNVALIFVFYLTSIIKKYPFSMIINPLALLMGGVIYSILFFSDGRTGFVVANCLLLMMIFYKLWNWKKKLAVVITMGAIVGMIFIIFSHPRINEKSLDKEPRFAIWNVAINVIKEKPIFGYGASSAADVFMEKGSQDKKFQESGDVFLLKMMQKRDIQGGNPHDVFLKSLMDYGIFGLFIMLSIFILPVLYANNQLRFTVFLLIFSVVFQLIFEIFPTGVSPIMFCLLLALFLSPPKERRKETTLIEG